MWEGEQWGLPAGHAFEYDVLSGWALPDSRDRTVPVSRAPSFYADLPKGRRESSTWLWLPSRELFLQNILDLKGGNGRVDHQIY